MTKVPDFCHITKRANPCMPTTYKINNVTKPPTFVTINRFSKNVTKPLQRGKGVQIKDFRMRQIWSLTAIQRIAGAPQNTVT